MVEGWLTEVDLATQLNIKDPILIERVRSLAERRQESVTATLRRLVDTAWNEREHGVEERLQGMKAWADAVYAEMPNDVKTMTSKEVMDSIYDDNEPDGFAR